MAKNIQNEIKSEGDSEEEKKEGKKLKQKRKWIKMALILNAYKKINIIILFCYYVCD